MKNESGNNMLSKASIMWKRVFGAWYNVSPTIIEKLYKSMPRQIAGGSS